MRISGSCQTTRHEKVNRRFQAPAFARPRFSPFPSKTQSIGLLVAAAWLSGCASPAPTPASNTAAPSSIEATAEDKPADVESIRAIIRADGSATVIILLNVPFTPEGDLPDDAAVQAQRAAIEQAQADVIEGLSATSAVVVMQSKFTPTMIVVIDEAGLDWLAQSPLVSAIQVDSAIPPAGPTL